MAGSKSIPNSAGESEAFTSVDMETFRAVGDSHKSQDDLHAGTGFAALRLGAVISRLLHADMPGVCRPRTYRPGRGVPAETSFPSDTHAWTRVQTVTCCELNLGPQITKALWKS